MTPSKQCLIKTINMKTISPSEEIWNRASASPKYGEISLQMPSSPLTFWRASPYEDKLKRSEKRQDVHHERDLELNLLKEEPYRGSMWHDVPTNGFDLKPGQKLLSCPLEWHQTTSHNYIKKKWINKYRRKRNTWVQSHWFSWWRIHGVSSSWRSLNKKNKIKGLWSK